jgi:hypothetical protein
MVVFSAAPGHRKSAWPNHPPSMPVSETMPCMDFTARAGILYTQIILSILPMCQSLDPMTAALSMNLSQRLSIRMRVVVGFFIDPHDIPRAFLDIVIPSLKFPLKW